MSMLIADRTFAELAEIRKKENILGTHTIFIENPEVVGREDGRYPVPAKSGRFHASLPPGCD